MGITKASIKANTFAQNCAIGLATLNGAPTPPIYFQVTEEMLAAIPDRRCQNDKCKSPVLSTRKYCSTKCARLVAARRWAQKQSNAMRMARREAANTRAHRNEYNIAIGAPLETRPERRGKLSYSEQNVERRQTGQPLLRKRTRADIQRQYRLRKKREND